MTDDSGWRQNIEMPSTEELLEDIQSDSPEDILANLEEGSDSPSHQNQSESPYEAARDHAESLGFEEIEKFGHKNWNTPVGTTVFRGWSGYLVLDQNMFSDSVRVRYADNATAWREKQDDSILDYKIDDLYGKKDSGSDETTADRMELEGVELDETAEDAVEARNYVSQAYDIDRGYDDKEKANADLLAELDDPVRS